MAHPGGISTAGHIYGSQKTGYFISVRKKSLISLEMPFYKTTELGNGYSVATHLKEVNNKSNAIFLHAYSSKKIGKKEF